MDAKLLHHILAADFGIDPKALEQALKDTVVYGGSIGTNLLELELVPEDILLKALAKRYGTPALDLRSIEVEPAALELIAPHLVRKHKVLPLRHKGKTLDLLMINPLDRVALAEVGVASGCIIKPYVVVETRLEELLEKHAGVQRGWRYRENPIDRVSQKRRSVSPASLHEARALLAAASHRDDVADTVIGYLLRFFKRALILVHRGELLVGWRGGLHRELQQGDTAEGPSLGGLYLPLTKPSVFKTVVETGSPYMGAFPDSKTHDYFLSVFGGGYPQGCFAAPIAVMSRTVNVVYGDVGPGGAITTSLTDVMLCLNAASEAYERLIREKLLREAVTQT
jgi:Type II secretion system (T2SS), protein E, N-terminal domain